MEPRGCNQWQSAANRLSAEGPKQAKTVATGCHQLRAKFHGKEGVDGSSPSEGFEKPLQMGGFFTYGVVHVDGARSHQVAPIDGTRPTPSLPASGP
jgi:hypothetical protein